MRIEIKEVIKTLIKTRKNSMIDNDFEKCVGIDYNKYKNAKKEDIIEVLHILEAILDENQISIEKIYGGLL